MACYVRERSRVMRGARLSVPLRTQMRTLRVAQVVATFPPYWAGTGNVAFHNAVELARRGHDVTVLTSPAEMGGHHDPAEIAVRRLPTPLRFGNAPFTPGLL